MNLSYFWGVSVLMLSLQPDLKLMQCRAVYMRNISDNDMSAVKCETEMREKCSVFSPSQNYSLKISSHVYSPRQEIKVKVYMTHCPSIHLSGPKWYQLEIMANESQSSPHNGKARGEFYPRQQHVLFCNQRTRVVFAACDPKSFDLPASYSWIASSPNGLSEQICFRLTVQVQGDDSCEEEVVCVQPLESESVDQESGDALLESGSGYDYDYYDSEHDSGLPLQAAHPDHPPSLNEDAGTSALQDHSSPTTVTSTCESDRHFFLSTNLSTWIPHCSCKGFYERVQCWTNNNDEMECWCSSALSGNLIGWRRKIICTDPSEIADFNCAIVS